jgi:hypothetical protein
MRLAPLFMQYARRMATDFFPDGAVPILAPRVIAPRPVPASPAPPAAANRAATAQNTIVVYSDTHVRDGGLRFVQCHDLRTRARSLGHASSRPTGGSLDMLIAVYSNPPIQLVLREPI